MISLSLDGFFEGPNREIGWHQMNEEVHQFANDELRNKGAFLQGRTTYDLMESYWPFADQEPDCPAPILDFAEIWRNMPKIVYSRTLREASPNTTLVREVVPEEVVELKKQPGGDLALGGSEVVDAFRRYDLVDEYCIFFHPVILGKGNPFFKDGSPRTNLELKETKHFTNGVVFMRYRRI